MGTAEKIYSVPPRDNNINFLRFIAASLVIWFHMASLLGVPEPYIMGQGLGPIAVNIFFILSGYLIAKSWSRSSSFGSYLIRRVARIFPGLIVVVLLSVFVMGPVVTSLSAAEYFGNPETWKYLSMIVLAPIENVLPGVFDTNPLPYAVNGSLWTLRYEFLAYLLMPLFYILTKGLGKGRKPFFVAVLAALVFVHFLSYSGVYPLPKVFDNFFRLFAYYMAGVVAFELGLERYCDAQFAVVALLVMILFRDEVGLFSPLVMFAAVCIFTLGFSLTKNPRFAPCFKKNDYSYGIYIYAFPIQQCVVWLGGASLPCSYLSCSFLSFGITLMFAIASWFLVEKPAMDYGRKLAKRWTSRKAAS